MLVWNKTEMVRLVKTSTKKEPIRTLGCNSRLRIYANNSIYFPIVCKRCLWNFVTSVFGPFDLPFFPVTLINHHALFQACMTNVEDVCLVSCLDKVFFYFSKRDYFWKIPLTRPCAACLSISHISSFTRAAVWSDSVCTRSCTTEALMVTAGTFIYIYIMQNSEIKFSSFHCN